MLSYKYLGRNKSNIWYSYLINAVFHLLAKTLSYGFIIIVIVNREMRQQTVSFHNGFFFKSLC